MIVEISTEVNVILTGLLKSWLRRIHGNLHNSGSYDDRKDWPSQGIFFLVIPQKKYFSHSEGSIVGKLTLRPGVKALGKINAQFLKQVFQIQFGKHYCAATAVRKVKRTF